MSEKQHISRFRRAKGVSAELTWHNGADFEIHRYAQSLQKAAKTLVGELRDRRGQSAMARSDLMMTFRSPAGAYQGSCPYGRGVRGTSLVRRKGNALRH
jgi:hypothetical protein